MFFSRPKNVLAALGSDTPDLLLEALATSRPKIFPVFECVKVWCRLDKNSIMSFARSKEDVLAGGVSPSDVISKFKSGEIKQEVYDILCVVSESLSSKWPFFGGSSSWMLLEVLSPVLSRKAGKNERTLILRETARLSYSRGRIYSPLSEKVFNHMDKEFEHKGIRFTSRPFSFLESSSGTGFLTEAISESKVATTAIKTFVKNIVKYNSDVISSFGYPRGGIMTEKSYVTGIDVLFGGSFFRLSTQEDIECFVNDKTIDTKVSPIWRM